MDYMGIIRRGLSLTWKNKFMWLLGFLAALGSSAGSSNSGFRFGGNDLNELSTLSTSTSGTFLIFGIIAFILAIVLMLISLSARAGLIHAAATLDKGTTDVSFGRSFRFGWSRVGRLIALAILLFVVPVLILAFLGLAYFIPVSAVTTEGGFSQSQGGLAGAGAILLFCVLALVGVLLLVFSLIHPFAFRGIVLRDMGVIESIRHGWQVLRSNLGEIIVLGLAFFLVGLVISLLAFAILAPIALIIGAPIARIVEGDASVITAILAIVGILIGIIIFAIISAITTAWQSSTFTLAYQQWTGKAVKLEE